MLRVVQRARAEGVAAEFLIWSGDVASGILAAAEAESADVVVVGTHGRDRTGRLLLGSVSDRLVHDAPMSVFVVRPGAHRDRVADGDGVADEWHPSTGPDFQPAASPSRPGSGWSVVRAPARDDGSRAGRDPAVTAALLMIGADDVTAGQGPDESAWCRRDYDRRCTGAGSVSTTATSAAPTESPTDLRGRASGEAGVSSRGATHVRSVWR